MQCTLREHANVGCPPQRALPARLLPPTPSGFSPLEHFMSQAEYDSVVKDMRLPNGLLFGLPIVLDTNREDVNLGDKVGTAARPDSACSINLRFNLVTPGSAPCVCSAQPAAAGSKLMCFTSLSCAGQVACADAAAPPAAAPPAPQVLLQYQGQDLAVLTVGDKWVPNKPLECLKCYGTSSLEHPAVQMVAMERGRFYLGESRQPPAAGIWQLPTAREIASRGELQAAV